jgi:hypothetical protein
VTAATFDVLVEFINGQKAWHTIAARSSESATSMVVDYYEHIGVEPYAVTPHTLGTRPRGVA